MKDIDRQIDAMFADPKTKWQKVASRIKDYIQDSSTTKEEILRRKEEEKKNVSIFDVYQLYKQEEFKDVNLPVSYYNYARQKTTEASNSKNNNSNSEVAKS